MESETYQAQKNFKFIASGVYIKSIAMKNSGRQIGSARIQFHAISDVTIRGGLNDIHQVVSDLYFPLSDLNFAVQEEWVAPDYSGQL